MSAENFDWKEFQKQTGIQDAELEIIKSDPRRAKVAERTLGSPEFQKKYLIIEVVKSDGCAAGLKVGDSLYFKGCSVLDLEKSGPWCNLAFGNFDMLATLCHERWVAGLDLDDLHFNHIPCVDTGVRGGGWGQVVMKGYVKDESEL